eukprot:1022718-Pyramimonas_sp.AAC.2
MVLITSISAGSVVVSTTVVLAGASPSARSAFATRLDAGGVPGGLFASDSELLQLYGNVMVVVEHHPGDPF